MNISKEITLAEISEIRSLYYDRQVSPAELVRRGYNKSRVKAILDHISEVKRQNAVNFSGEPPTLEDMMKELPDSFWSEYRKTLRAGVAMSHTQLPEYFEIQTKNSEKT